MLKNKILIGGLTAALCAVMLASCGGGTTTQTETETKPPIPSKKMITERSRELPNGGAIGGAMHDFERGIERGMNDMKNRAEDATNGTARQDGHENETEAEGVMPKREHRSPAPRGK